MTILINPLNPLCKLFTLIQFAAISIDKISTITQISIYLRIVLINHINIIIQKAHHDI